MDSTSEKTPYEIAAELLQFVSPDVDRRTWVTIGSVLRYELSEDDAHSLFREWSEGGEKFSPRDFNTTWNRIRPGTAKMATLFHHAKEGGYRGKAANISTEYLQQRAIERAKELKTSNDQLEQERRIARRDAQRFWGYSQKPKNDHPYLVKKKIETPLGIREFTSRKGTRFLQIPCFNKDGVLMSLQSINEEGGKYFQKGAQIMGGSMSIGKSSANKELPVVICEGWATGMSLHKASGLQTVIAFNSINLPNIVQNVREAYPERQIIIAADNDFENKAGNVGVKAAEEGSKRIDDKNVFIIKPEFSENEIEAFRKQNNGIPTDFNDMDVFFGEDVLFSRVQAQIEANIQSKSNELSANL